MAIFIKDLGLKAKFNKTKKHRYCIVECEGCGKQSELATAKYNSYPDRMCKSCGQRVKNEKSRLERECKFIHKAMSIHKAKYTYSSIGYVNNHTKVTITCNGHAFTQRPDDHLQGKGCSVCANRVPLDVDTFIERSVEIHGDTYDYSIVKEIVNSNTTIDILCKKHGVFSPTPGNHIHKKSGCPRCMTGTDADAIYIWQLDNSNTYKIGITSSRLGDTRMKDVAKSFSKALGSNVVANVKILISLDTARDVESHLLSKFTSINTYFPKCDGSTELRVLSSEDLVYCLKYINNAVSKGLLT